MSVLDSVLREARERSGVPKFHFSFEVKYSDGLRRVSEDSLYSTTKETELLKDASKRAYFFFTRGLLRTCAPTVLSNGDIRRRYPVYVTVKEDSVHRIAKELIDEFNENNKIGDKGLHGIERDVEKLLKYGKEKNHVGRCNHMHPDVYRRWIPSKWAYNIMLDREHKP